MSNVETTRVIRNYWIHSDKRTSNMERRHDFQELRCQGRRLQGRAGVSCRSPSGVSRHQISHQSSRFLSLSVAAQGKFSERRCCSLWAWNPKHPRQRLGRPQRVRGHTVKWSECQRDCLRHRCSSECRPAHSIPFGTRVTPHDAKCYDAVQLPRKEVDFANLYAPEP